MNLGEDIGIREWHCNFHNTIRTKKVSEVLRNIIIGKSGADDKLSEMRKCKREVRI